MKYSYEFIWSDGWYVEGNEAWFVDGARNVLYCLNRLTKECKYISKLPDKSGRTFRMNPQVIKIEKEVFCMPDMGDRILIYDLADSKFSQIVIDNPHNVRLTCTGFWHYNDKIFVVVSGLKQIIEINIKEKHIDHYYTISNLSEEKLGRCIRSGTDIYMTSAISNKIYQFNLETRQIAVYILQGIEDGLFTICFDGRKFWLSGYKKEIYIWDKENNLVEIVRDFPKDFGEYDFSGKEETLLNCNKNKYIFPAFLQSQVIGEFVWFIPFKTNKIVYININTNERHTFEMPDEEETKESLMTNQMASKYLLQYLLNSQYLGLFSFKNDWIIEIDTKNLKTEVKTFSFNFEKYANDTREYLFTENNLMDKNIFKYLLITDKKDTLAYNSMVMGKKIYNQLK